MIEDSAIALLVAHSSRRRACRNLREGASARSRKRVHRRGIGRTIWMSAGPEQVAYVIYTFRLTGKPKAVMIAQSCPGQLSGGHAQDARVRESDILLSGNAYVL